MSLSALAACSGLAPPPEERQAPPSETRDQGSSTETPETAAEDKRTASTGDSAAAGVEIQELLDYYERVGDYSEGERRAALQRLRPEIAPRACSRARVKLAMLALQDMTLVDAPDELLRPCRRAASDAPPSRRRLARILADLLGSRLAQRDAAKRREALVDERDALRRRNRQLKEQLEGLKQIERSLQQREGS